MGSRCFVFKVVFIERETLNLDLIYVICYRGINPVCFSFNLPFLLTMFLFPPS